MSTTLSSAWADDNGSSSAADHSILYPLQLSTTSIAPMSLQHIDAPGALQSPVQLQLALDLADRFNPISHGGFVPQPLTGMTSFPLYPHGDPAVFTHDSSPPPGAAAIYQEYSREEPQNRGYDVDVSRFLRHWHSDSEYMRARNDTTGMLINSSAEDVWLSPRPAHIRACDLKGDSCDMQGFDWASLGTTRASARITRSLYCDTVHMRPTSHTVGHAQPHLSAPALDLFRFRRMNTRHRAWIEHFQLRNALRVASSSDILYLHKDKVLRTDAMGSPSTVVCDLTHVGEQLNGSAGFGNTALATSADIVVTGSRYGQYAMASLTARRGSKPTVGLINTNPDGMICHAEVFRRRGQGRASTVAFACNDETVRILDCATNTFLSKFSYGHAMNCTSTDPHGQMRLVAGDNEAAYVTAADSGEVLKTFTHHTAHIHAASWSSDGIHLATGAEDHRVLVYDARNWSSPVSDIACRTACPRSLKFSPERATHPALLIAEAEDVVSVVDATAGMFSAKQDIEFFGSVAGIDWRPDGRTFWVAGADARFGGLAEFERNGASFAEAEAIGGARLERLSGRARAAQRERGARNVAVAPSPATASPPAATAAAPTRPPQNERKRSSWQISSSSPSEAAEPAPPGAAGKRRSLQSATSSSASVSASLAAPPPAADCDCAPGTAADPSTSPQQRYIQRVQRARTRGMPSRARRGLGRLLNA